MMTTPNTDAPLARMSVTVTLPDIADDKQRITVDHDNVGRLYETTQGSLVLEDVYAFPHAVYARGEWVRVVVTDLQVVKPSFPSPSRVSTDAAAAVADVSVDGGVGVNTNADPLTNDDPIVRTSVSESTLPAAARDTGETVLPRLTPGVFATNEGN